MQLSSFRSAERAASIDSLVMITLLLLYVKYFFKIFKNYFAAFFRRPERAFAPFLRAALFISTFLNYNI